MEIYELITERIVSELEKGSVPWRKTWTTGAPKSLTTGREYRGINYFLLRATAYSSRYWMTYKQAAKLGGQVRRGEKATPVVYWKWRTPAEMAKLVASGKATNPAPCYPFVSFVFNLDQVDGVERPADDVRANPEGRIEEAEAIIRQMPNRPEIVHGSGLNPAYIPSLDRVQMPNLSQFDSPDFYYASLFHELTHATSSPSRLNRVGEGDRKRAYSFEELVAELGAAFLCGASGIENRGTLEDSAAYIGGWLKVLREDKKILLQAGSAAQKAADFILDRQEKAEAQDEERAAA